MDNARGPIIKAVMNERVQSLRPGDIVLLPEDSYNATAENVSKAKVERIYPHIVTLKTIPDNRTVSLSYFEASRLQVIRPAEFQSRTQEMDEEAIGRTLDTIRNRRD